MENNSRLKQKPLTQLEGEKNNYNQEQLPKLWGPVLNEQGEVLVQNVFKKIRW